MTRKKVGGFIFESYKANHAPLHVHVHDGNGGFLGRFDIENQVPMERGFELTKNIKKALEEAGYIPRKNKNIEEV